MATGTRPKTGTGPRDSIRPDVTRLDVDGDSIVSFQSGPAPPRPAVKYAWSNNDKVGKESGLGDGAGRTGSGRSTSGRCCTQVNHEVFHRMLEDHREAKKREMELELKCKQ